MPTDKRAPWEHAGYADITSARLVDGNLEVDFGNGDRERIPVAEFGISADTITEIEVEDGLSVLLLSGSRVTPLSWVAIRSATDQSYATHLRDLERTESWHIGRRIKALREDRGLSRLAIAQAVGIPVSLLRRIEDGAGPIDSSIVRTLVRELGASVAEISGSDALETPVRTILTRAEEAGVPRELGATLSKVVSRRTVPRLFERAFGWLRDAVLSGVPETPSLPLAVQFKALSGQSPASSPMVHLALAAAETARLVFEVPEFQEIAADVEAIRRQGIDGEGRVTLESLLDWAWGKGVPVLPLEGKGVFTAAVLGVGGGPVIVIKESRDLAPFWLFDLAHEIGHLVLGHVKTALVDVQSPTAQVSSDADEQAATEFALELLLPGHRALIEAVRRKARGSGVRFKFAVEDVASDANVSAGLLGVVAAHELVEVGRPLDRWGSATNLSKPEGSGRGATRSKAERRLLRKPPNELDAALIRAVVFPATA